MKKIIIEYRLRRIAKKQQKLLEERSGCVMWLPHYIALKNEQALEHKIAEFDRRIAHLKSKRFELEAETMDLTPAQFCASRN
jgi:ABC-type amino acid transport substrate-binding protein